MHNSSKDLWISLQEEGRSKQFSLGMLNLKIYEMRRSWPRGFKMAYFKHLLHRWIDVSESWMRLVHIKFDEFHNDTGYLVYIFLSHVLMGHSRFPPWNQTILSSWYSMNLTKCTVCSMKPIIEFYSLYITISCGPQVSIETTSESAISMVLSSLN